MTRSTSALTTKSLNDFPVDRRSCQLLGPTALMVQALMGLLVVLSLVYKRHRETQKRPWKIWLFDVSKQIFGQMFVHGVNVLISDFGSYHTAGNACTYYFLNILLDTTLGVGLLYLALQGSTWLFSKRLGFKGLKTGQYGNPPSIIYWIRQTAVYVFSISIMKFILVALYTVWPGISSIGDWLLSWIGDGEKAQVIFVLGIFPMLMNVVQFWLIDSIVKASTSSTAVRPASPRDPDSLDREPLFSSPDDDDDDDISPRDIENGPTSDNSRMTSEGDSSKTLVGAEDIMSKYSTPGSSSASMTGALVTAPVAVAHNYPPDNADAASSQGSTRTRHKYKRSPSSLLDLPIAYSLPSLNSMRNPARQALLSKPYIRDVAEFDVREKDEWKERAGGEGDRTWSGSWTEPIQIQIGAR